MDTSEMIIKQLSTPPSGQIEELPIVTTNKVLPFDKLPWEDFEKFCFQLGSKSMKCLDTSYIYGRKGQKQDGIDLYFRQETKNKVWQIKRYAEFKQADVAAAVEVFLDGKWSGNVTEFTLCVSNYLDDTGVVDEIDKQSAVLESKGITFSVLNSEKLTIKAKAFPDLIEAFFGKHWLTALGLAQAQKPELETVPRWQTDSGKVLDSQKIYHHGDFNVRFDGHTIYVDEQLPDGADTHAVLDSKTGAIRVEKFPYPLEEYKINVPEKLIIRLEEGMTEISGKRYYAKRYHLKWGKSATFIFDSDDHDKLIDMHIETRTFINHTQKVINVLDPASQAIDL